MATKLFYGVLLALFMSSMIILIPGHARGKTRGISINKLSPTTRKYCRGMTWLNKHHKKICYRFPDMIAVIQKGVELALEECRRQFRLYRWNCTPLDYKMVLSEHGILRKRSRETAFVQALTSASVMMEIAKKCVATKLKYCGCGSLSRRDRNDITVMEGCGDNVNFGAYLSARFLDPRRTNTHARKAKRHNQITGRKIVRQNVQRKCDCDSYMAKCNFQTCKRIVPTLEKVGDEIWKLYLTPIRSYWNKTNKRLYNGEKTGRETRGGNTRQLEGKLVYFKRSEDFCEENYSMSISGTKGRICNRTSYSHGGCATLCCGRSYKTTVVVQEVKCNCRFVWCCSIKCEKCIERQAVHKCL